MVTISGEMATLLAALGHRRGDSRILEAIILVGPRMEVSEFDLDGHSSVYYLFKPAGTELLFEDDILVSVMARTQLDAEDKTNGTYPRPLALIDGLSPNATCAEIMTLLGAPQHSGPSFYRYDANGHYLHFEFDPLGQVTKLSALLEAI